VLLFMKDGSFFQNTADTGVTVDTDNISYMLKENEGNHSGLARVQLIVQKPTLVEYATQHYRFRIESGLETAVVQEVIIADWTTLTSEAREYIDEMEVNETIRLSQEQARVANEDSRILSEAERETNEDDRISNESGRVISETERNLNEQARILDAQTRNEELIEARYSGYAGHTYDNLGQRLDTMESAGLTNEILDYTNAPGSKALMAGTREDGFYGFVQPQEFGWIESNPTGSQAFNGQSLALSVGLASGTAINTDTAWMKFSRKGEIYLVPVKPLRHSAVWNAIYNQGAVYGTGGTGVNPPNGRAGNRLSVVGGVFTIGRTGTDGFLNADAVLGAVGSIIVTRGFVNSANNGEFTITAITDTTITVTGSLVDEGSAPKASIYEKSKAVNQNRDVVSGGNRYRVQLLKGADNDPLNSYTDSDRDMVGPNSEWNNLILPLHERAKLQNWEYSVFAGTTENWDVGLTDADLITHRDFGTGSYTWCQETSDGESYRRVVRGYYGVSSGSRGVSWSVASNIGWRPVLRLLS